MGKKGKKKEETKDDVSVPEKLPPTEKEIQLTEQLRAITDEVERAKREVEEMKTDNDFLVQEAQTVTAETHEYLSYMTKKKQKRHEAVITLSERHSEQIHEIQEKKKETMRKYGEQKQELRKVIMEKEGEMARLKDDLDGLEEYKMLRNQQKSEISSLESRVGELRVKHNEAVQTLKAKFLAEKNEFQTICDDHLNELNREARKEANLCLQNHSKNVKMENRRLRRELLELLHRTRTLYKHKLDLEEQHKILLREKETAVKIKQLKAKQLIGRDVHVDV